MGSLLLDPRWHWIISTARRLHAEMDSDAVPASLSLLTENDSELISYAVVAGSPEIERRVITDIDKVADAVIASTVDLTPDRPGDIR